MRGLSYVILTRSISWLLMPWLLSSPGHQQPCYWLCRIGRSLSFWRKDFNYLCHVNVEEWYVFVPSEKFSMLRVNSRRKTSLYTRLSKIAGHMWPNSALIRMCQVHCGIYVIDLLTLKRLGNFFQNIILFPSVVHYKCSIFIWNWPSTMNV